MRYLKPLRPFLAWSQLSIPTVYDDSLSYYEVLNKCIFHFNEMLKIMQENYEIIDEAFAKILEECEAAIARCEEAAARAEAAQSAAEKAQAAAEAAQAAAEAAQKLAEAAQAAAEAARDDAVTAQKAAEAAQAAAEAAQAAAETAQQKAETAQAAAETAQAKAEDAQEKAESARDAAQAAQTAAEAAQQKAEAAQNAAESARDAAETAQREAEAAQEAAEASEQAAADSAADAAASAEEIKNALDNYYDKTESDATFVKKAGDTMTGNLVMNTKDNPNNGTVYLDGAATRFRTIYLEGNQDFNNLILNGIYYRPSTTRGDKNYPSTLDGINFILIVIAGTSNKIVKQIFFSYETSQGIYIRFSYLNQDEINFGSWKKIATTAEINNSLSGYLPLTGGTMTGDITMSGNAQLIGNASTSNTWKYSTTKVTDLNDLKTGGIYRLNGANISNSPSTTYFDIIVLTNNENNLYTQIVITNIFLAKVYLRVGNNNGFGNWITFSSSNDLNNYLPLSGGTMTGKINVQDEWNDTFTGLSKGNYVTTISENSDLNNVKTNSINFYPPNIAILEESKNFPVKVSGFLVSLVQNPSIFIRQIYCNSLSNTIYTRVYKPSQNSWSNWEKILFETDIVGNYLPLSGGTMTGNITMSDNTKLIGNAETSDFFKLIHIPNASDMNKIIESGFYAIASGDSVSNAPEDISAETNAFSCFVFPWQYPNTTGISQLIFSGDGPTVKGIYFRLTNNPEVGWSNWVRLDNVDSEVQLDNQSGIYYKISENNNIYKLEVWLAKTLNLTAFGYANTFTSDSLNVSFENISELANITKLINESISYSVGFTTNSTKGSATVNSYIDENNTTTIVLRLISLIGGEEGSVTVTIPKGNKILDCIIPKS